MRISELLRGSAAIRKGVDVVREVGFDVLVITAERKLALETQRTFQLCGVRADSGNSTRTELCRMLGYDCP